MKNARSGELLLFSVADYLLNSLIVWATRTISVI